jgi:MFS family permease
MEPIGLKWRSHPAFILTTVGMALFSDLFLFALIVPILPFILEDRLGTPPSQVQTRISALLTAFSCASVIFSPFIGWAADKMQSRRSLYLFGVLLLTAATVLMFSARTFPLLIVSRVIQGASGSMVWVMGMALCCETVGEEHLGKAIGTVSAFRPEIIKQNRRAYLFFDFDSRFLVSSSWGLCSHLHSAGPSTNSPV